MKTNLISAVVNLVSASEFGDLITDLYSLLWGWLLGAFAGGAMLLGLWYASKWIFAGGDEAKVKKAREATKTLVIGIIILALIAGGLPMVLSAVMSLV